jgi:hypothetical protein
MADDADSLAARIYHLNLSALIPAVDTLTSQLSLTICPRCTVEDLTGSAYVVVQFLTLTYKSIPEMFPIASEDILVEESRESVSIPSFAVLWAVF